MKILLLGNTGQLGSELNEILPQFGELHAFDYPEIDLADADGMRALIRKIAPDVIYNATAYTAVDRAETDIELAEAINGRGAGLLAEEAVKLDALLIHFSTDYVFDGEKGAPYLEDDAPNPLSVYGSSKLHGDEEIKRVDGAYLIFRPCWVYSLRNESGFVKKVLGWARKYEQLSIVDDQISNPTWARTLAKLSTEILREGLPALKAKSGIYHLAGKGHVSRYGWAKEVLALDPAKDEQIVKEIRAAKSEDFPVPAQRPTFSALDCSLFEKTFHLTIPAWQESLAEAFSL